MAQENNEKEHKIYCLAESPEKLADQFVKNLQDGMSWANDTTEHWAELRTFHLPKNLVLFNLGVLGFVGAMQGGYHFPALLVAIFLSVISVLLSFWFMWKVSKENINIVNDRRMIMQRTLERIFKEMEPKAEIRNDYNGEITGIERKTREKEKCWNQILTVSVWCFIISMIVAVLGIIW